MGTFQSPTFSVNWKRPTKIKIIIQDIYMYRANSSDLYNLLNVKKYIIVYGVPWGRRKHNKVNYRIIFIFENGNNRVGGSVNLRL